MSYRQTGFQDDRRAPYGVYESYKPGQRSRDDRDYGSRDRSRDTDRDTAPPNREAYRDSDRRGSESRSYDRRDARDEKEFDRGRDKAKDNDTQSAGLQTSTNIPTGPRTSVASSRSPSATRAAPPPVRAPAADRSTPSDTAVASPITTAPPAKRQDPKYMAAYETLSKFGEVLMRRSAFHHQKMKKKREMERRASEAKQYVGKYDDFPSMLETHTKMKERDLKEYANIENDVKRLDKMFLQQVDDLATALSAPSECQASVMPAPADLSSLEAKFALFQKEFDIAKGEIRELEVGRQKADDEIKKLERERQDSEMIIKELQTANSNANQVILGIRSNCTTLEQKQVQLESEMTQLLAQTEGRNKTLLEQVTSTESKLALLEKSKVSSTVLISATAEIRDSQKQEIADVKRRLYELNANEEHRHALDEKVSKLETLVEGIDAEKLNEVYDSWDALQIPDKVEHHERVIESLRQEIQSLPETNAHRGQPSDHLLQSEMVTLQGVVQQNTSVISALQHKFNTINANVQKTTSAMGEAIGLMIDDMGKRIHKLEQLPTNHGASRTPAATPQLDARGSPAVGDARLEARMKAIEDQNLLELSEHIKLRLNTVEQSLKQSVEKMNANTLAYDGGLQDIKRSLQEISATHEEAKRQLEAQQLALNTLDTQIHNIFTKQLAEAIVKQLDAFSARVNPRMDVMETTVKQNESIVKQVESKMKQLEEIIATVRKGLVAVNPYYQQKRSVSPSNRHVSDDGGKRRKLDVNGRASSRPVQPLVNGNSAHH